MATLSMASRCCAVVHLPASPFPRAVSGRLACGMRRFNSSGIRCRLLQPVRQPWTWHVHPLRLSKLCYLWVAARPQTNNIGERITGVRSLSEVFYGTSVPHGEKARAVARRDVQCTSLAQAGTRSSLNVANSVKVNLRLSIKVRWFRVLVRRKPGIPDLLTRLRLITVGLWNST